MEKIKLGFIGVGGIAQGHVERSLKLPEVEIVALADTSEASIQRTQEKHGLKKVAVYADYRALLEKAKPDAVIISTPHTQHYQQIVDSLDAGAHVLVEKPMVCRSEDGWALVEKMKGSSKVLGLAYQRHCAAPYRFIKREIAGGKHGKVQYISAVLQQGWAKGTKGSWRQDPALSGGGQINDSGSHVIDMMLWSTGLVPDKVFAIMDNRDTPVDINSSISMQFVGGAQGTIAVIGDAAGWYEDNSYWTDSASFSYRTGHGFQMLGPDGKPVEVELPEESNINTNFIRAIQGKEEVAAKPIDGLRTITLTEALWKSAGGGTVVDVDRKPWS
jgi:predicted dehydrogenase